MQSTQSPAHSLRNVLVIAASFFFIFFSFGTAQQYLVINFKQHGHEQVALICLFLLYGAFLFASIAITKLIPYFGGLKRSLILAALVYAAFVASIALGAIPLLIVMSVLIGGAVALLWISSQQIITDSSDEHTNGRNLAIQQIGQYAGNIAGIFAGGYMTTALTMPEMYLTLALTGLIGSFLLMFVEPVKEEVRERPFRPLFLLDRRMLLLFPLIFGTLYLLTEVFVGMNIITIEVLGLSFIPVMVTIVKISNIIGSFGSGTLGGWVDKTKLLIALILIAIAGILCFVAAHSTASLLGAAVLLGFSMSAISPVMISLLKQKMPDDEFLYALGANSVYGNVGVLAAIGANIALSPSIGFLPGAIALVIAIPCLVKFRSVAAR